MARQSDLQQWAHASGILDTEPESLPVTPELPEAYYDSGRKEFLLQNGSGSWLAHADASFKRNLRSLGFSNSCSPGMPVSQIEAFMVEVQNYRDVAFAGPLAGKSPGIVEENGFRILVTHGPRLPAPAPGEWPVIHSILNGVLGTDPTHGARQIASIHGWLKIAFQALASGKLQPGQALALAGPVGCGKSLIQTLITEILGGRSAKAYRYLAGQTQFNAEFFGAEHLMLEDENSSTDIRARRALAAQIKGIAVNTVHSCHQKGRTAINIRPFWRLSISMNDQPERLMVLPPLDDDIADKIILLRCTHPQAPFPTETPEARERFWKTIQSEVPGYLDFLAGWEIPTNLRDNRFGIRHFHHPDLVEAITDLDPEIRLLELIDTVLFSDGQKGPWEGTAAELEKWLQDSSFGKEADRLFSWSAAAGTYLGRLAEKHPNRIEAHRSSQRREWVIRKP